MMTAFEQDLAATLAMNPGWTLVWDADPVAAGGEFVCRLQNLESREEVNGNDVVSRDRALEILLVRMELSGRFEMPPGLVHTRPHNDMPGLFVAEVTDGEVYFSGVGASPDLAFESLLVALSR